jgi:hypothetical protein
MKMTHEQIQLQATDKSHLIGHVVCLKDGYRCACGSSCRYDGSRRSLREVCDWLVEHRNCKQEVRS